MKLKSKFQPKDMYFNWNHVEIMKFNITSLILALFLIYFGWGTGKLTFSQDDTTEINIGIVYRVPSCYGAPDACSLANNIALQTSEKIETRLKDFKGLNVSTLISLSGRDLDSKKYNLISYALPSKTVQCDENHPNFNSNFDCQDKDYIFYIESVNFGADYFNKLQVKNLSQEKNELTGGISPNTRRPYAGGWSRLGGEPIEKVDHYLLPLGSEQDETSLISKNASLAADYILGKFHKKHPEVFRSKRVFHTCLEPALQSDVSAKDMSDKLEEIIVHLTENLREPGFTNLAKEEELQSYYILGPTTADEYTIFCGGFISQPENRDELPEEQLRKLRELERELLERKEVYEVTSNYAINGKIDVTGNFTRFVIEIYLKPGLRKDEQIKTVQQKTLKISMPYPQGKPDYTLILNKVDACIKKYWLENEKIIDITWDENLGENECP